MNSLIMTVMLFCGPLLPQVHSISEGQAIAADAKACQAKIWKCVADVRSKKALAAITDQDYEGCFQGADVK